MNKPMAEAETEFAPLDVKCTSTKCEAGLHCFLPDRKMARRKQRGPCRSCGKELVDWARLEKRDPADLDYTFGMLKLEFVRHEYWCDKAIDPKAVRRAHRAGTKALRQEAERILRRSVGPAKHPAQGRQTPWDGNVVFYGQHATASCCRRCIEVWHGIPRTRDLTGDEIGYFTELVCRYIQQRLPDLTEGGEPDWSEDGSQA